jgi:DNA-binding transcriptional MerR regulator
MKKLYYSIGEVSEITEVEPHVLRYWEDTFSELSPSKNKGGQRTYTDNDIETVLHLKDLIHRQKYSTAGARKVLNDDQTDAEKQLLTFRRDLKEARYLLSKLLEEL